MVLKCANGGKLGYGDISRINKDYVTSECKEVSYRNLHYRLKLLREKGKCVMASDVRAGVASNNTIGTNTTSVSAPSTAATNTPPTNNCSNNSPGEEIFVSSLTTNNNDYVQVNVNVNVHHSNRMQSTVEGLEKEIEEEENICKTRGRKRGSKNKASEELLRLIREAVTKVT
jgi:hypothetical protein